MNNIANVANAFLLVYAALFPIVNPVGSAALFLRLTQFVSQPARETLARGVAVNSFMLLLGSLLIGSHVLVFFGITLPIVRIAGGLVVAAFGWKLLHAGEEPDDRRSAADNTPGASVDAFYPLTMPLTVGPGSISVAVTLGSQRPSSAVDLSQLAMFGGGAIAGLAAIAATVYVCYRYAGSIVAGLGDRGSRVVMRLSAFILFCIGIQIIWNGYMSLIPATH
ncbi:antibiotic resistance protein [Afipia sp. Root123D2]|uniref:MarC family protein n=1 Tax=Afipia sp. Root123D2 TaxID=1736436 RepID=UPI0006FCF8D9|nr:MarC family protein [Afipia sp. Root123D2]KQW19269.1 antibiotic resistance protein [Afipia sp. Root123D2]